MKKLLRISLAVVAISSMFAACKSHERCPAYGQIGGPKHHSTAIRG